MFQPLSEDEIWIININPAGFTAGRVESDYDIEALVNDSQAGGWRIPCWPGSTDSPWLREEVDFVDCRRDSANQEFYWHPLLRQFVVSDYPGIRIFFGERLQE